LLSVAKVSRLASLLQIRQGEGRTVAWLFAHAFFGGIPLTLSSAAGNALFLEHHGASKLPWVYLAAAAVVPAVGWACLKIEKTVAFDRFLLTVVGLIVAGQLAARASILVFGLEHGTWALPLWSELEYSLTSLELWALAGRLLNVQQVKRLLGVVGSGAPLAGGIAGLASPLFVRWLGTPNLLVLSALASVGSLLVLRRICSDERERLTVHAPDEERPKPRAKAAEPTVDYIGGKAPARKPKEKPDSTQVALRPYIRATYALMAATFVSYYLLERLFYERAEAREPDAAHLASFLGVFMGICGLLSLVFRAWLSAQLLSRWGLLVGLLTLPCLIAVGALSATTAGLIAGAGAASVFWAVVMIRAADRVLHDSLDMQAAFMLYQPLPRSTRVAVQGTGEAIIGPLAGGFAGGLLIVLDRLGVDVVRLSAITAGIAIGWLLIANHLRHAYRGVLERALAEHRLRPDDVVLGESARAPLLRALESDYAGEVLYALDMLEEIGSRTARPPTGRGSTELRPERVLKKLLRHPSADVRLEALRRIESGALAELLPDVTALAEKETDDRVRCRAFRVVAAIADDDQAEQVWMEGNGGTDIGVRRAVMIGCLVGGSIDRAALAWHSLRQLAESSDPAHRVIAAGVLRKVGSGSFHRPLLKLLGDENHEVQRASIVACRTVHHARLLPIVAGALRSRALRAAACATLSAIGEPCLPILRDLVHELPDWRVRERVLRIAARVKGPMAQRLALDLLGSTEEEVRHGALLALLACRYRPDESSVATAPFERLISTEVADATWTLAALIDLDVEATRSSLTGAPSSTSPSSRLLDQDGMALVTRALRRELMGSRDRILLLLSFLYDAQAMHSARASHASSSQDRRAIALEILDNALPASVRRLVIPLFDDLSARQALASMPRELVEDEIEQGRRGRLRDLVDPKRANVTSWTRTCAMWALRDPVALHPFEGCADDDVRETARYLIHTTESGAKRGSPMLTVEKVLILRSVPIFERTPDHILSELATILKEVDLDQHVQFISEGDVGDCMFVIVDGAVKVHRGDELLAELGSRDIVGEMSVLDPEPRSASVTTTRPTRVLRIDRDDFFELMADRIEIAQGILGVLCQRLRGLGSRPLSLLPPGSGTSFTSSPRPSRSSEEPAERAPPNHKRL
jgi:HEAT repeat protein